MPFPSKHGRYTLSKASVNYLSSSSLPHSFVRQVQKKKEMHPYRCYLAATGRPENSCAMSAFLDFWVGECRPCPSPLPLANYLFSLHALGLLCERAHTSARAKVWFKYKLIINEVRGEGGVLSAQEGGNDRVADLFGKYWNTSFLLPRRIPQADAQAAGEPRTGSPRINICAARGSSR